jgi:hypothetical protein
MSASRSWSVILGAALAALLTTPAIAQIAFLADFEDNSKAAVPGPEVNDVNNWDVLAPGQTIVVTDHPTNGTLAMKITVEGCGNSGMFMPPSIDNFTDGIIQVEMNPGDDDSFGVVFRRASEVEGYIVFFGVTETPSVIVAGLDKCGGQGVCWSDNGCENAANTIAQEPHGMALGIANNSDILGRVEVNGDRIRVWYALLEDVVNPMAKKLDIDPIIDVTDSDFGDAGAVGLWHESMANGFYDNFWVSRAGGLAVDAAAKAAVTWGHLKAR